jgi:diacylglycerol kinase (ATP)
VKILFIINCSSGNGKGLKYAKLIEDWYKKRGIKSTICYTSKDGQNSAFELGKMAAQEGYKIVGIVGGDGTCHLVVSGMMASNIPFEQLPAIALIQAGTGNNLAKNLRIPKNLIEVLKAIEVGKKIKVDIGRLILENEEKIFLNVVSFGFDALVTGKARKMKEKYPFIPKSLTYGLAAAREIIFKGMPSYRIKLQGLGLESDTELSLVALLNGPTYGAIFKIAPGADLSDGLFNLCFIKKMDNRLQGRIRAVLILLFAILGKHVGKPEVVSRRTNFLNISSPENIPCEADGEVLPAGKEYEIKIIPGGLRVSVP